MSEEMNKVETVVESTQVAEELPIVEPVAKKAIKLNFDNVTGYTLIRCEKAAKKEDPNISVPSISLTYQAHVAAAAAGVKVDDIYALPGKEFTKVCLDTQNFLLGSEK